MVWKAGGGRESRDGDGLPVRQRRTARVPGRQPSASGRHVGPIPNIPARIPGCPRLLPHFATASSHLLSGTIHDTKRGLYVSLVSSPPTCFQMRRPVAKIGGFLRIRVLVNGIHGTRCNSSFSDTNTHWVPSETIMTPRFHFRSLLAMVTKGSLDHTPRQAITLPCNRRTGWSGAVPSGRI